MKEGNTFQIILLGVFGFFILIGFASFMLFKGKAASQAVDVTLWGTLPETEVMSAIGAVISDSMKITYVKHDERTFDEVFVNALASGTGPDLVLLSEDSIYRHKDKLLLVPYESFPVRDFKESFIEEGEIFLWGQGSIALPFRINPLVMYWNRDLFSNAGLVVPPKTWGEFLSLVPKLTRRDRASNITQSTIGIGEFRNVNHAKHILSALFLQSGNPVVVMAGDRLTSSLNGQNIAAAVDFYTEFADPVKALYSWNRSLPDSKTMFLSGDLAVYFGFADEYFEFQSKNPNLNFDVALLPQPADAPLRKTAGRLTGIAISRLSPNPAGALRAAIALSGSPAISALSSASGLPPVRRDLLAQKPADNAVLGIFFDSAVIARSWFDPNPLQSGRIFENMIESITSGRSETGAAISRAHEELDLLLQ